MMNLNGKNLMVLGASYSQIPLMKAAKRLGCHVIAVSIPGPYQGFSYADEIVYADITKPDQVLKAAEERGISAVTTCCMDLGIGSMGYVNEKLGLHGPGIFAAEASMDKSVEKEAYRRCGVPTADFYLVHSKEELRDAAVKLGFPVMVKAVDQMGSRGITRADSEPEAEKAFASAMAATRKNFCLVEKFLDGTMFGVEAMISGGRPAYVLPLGNDLRDGNPPFPVGHYVPWQDGEMVRGKIEALVSGVAGSLRFDDCAMDLDCMYRNGEVSVIEATARAGATCITDTVSIYYGIDYYEAIVKAAFGMDVSGMFHGTDRRTPNLSRLLFADRKGIVKRVTVPEHLPGGVVDLSFNIREGSEVRPVTNGRDRIGQLIVKGDSVEACRSLQKKVLDGIHLEYGDAGSL